MRPLITLAQIIVARLWCFMRNRLRMAALLGLSVVLAACSALQLGYNQAPSLVFWWVDGYADLDEAQSTRVRQDIDRILAWHRQTELPTYAGRIRHWQAMAGQDVSGEQVCAQVEHLRTATERVMDRGHEPLAQLALTLSPAQLQHMERHQAKSNQSFEKDFIRGTPAQRMERRLSRTVDRYETLYGDLTPAQVQLVRRNLESSPFDPARSLAERRVRQGELLDLIRQLQATSGPRWTSGTPLPATAPPAVRAWLQRGLFPSPAAGSERAGWIRHGCDAFAALHNSTTPEQRQHAQALLATYASDLRALAGQD